MSLRRYVRTSRYPLVSAMDLCGSQARYRRRLDHRKNHQTCGGTVFTGKYVPAWPNYASAVGSRFRPEQWKSWKQSTQTTGTHPMRISHTGDRSGMLILRLRHRILEGYLPESILVIIRLLIGMLLMLSLMIGALIARLWRRSDAPLPPWRSIR